MPLKLQLLLQKGQRDEQTSHAVQTVLEELGLRPTAAGAATVSAEVDDEDFERVFGRKAGEAEPPGRTRDIAFSDDAEKVELPVPDRLRDYVASITVAPQYIRMSPAGESKE